MRSRACRARLPPLRCRAGQSVVVFTKKIRKKTKREKEQKRKQKRRRRRKPCCRMCNCPPLWPICALVSLSYRVCRISPLQPLHRELHNAVTELVRTHADAIGIALRNVPAGGRLRRYADEWARFQLGCGANFFGCVIFCYYLSLLVVALYFSLFLLFVFVICLFVFILCYFVLF